MIYTLTLNPAVDISLCVKGGLTPGQINRSYMTRTDPGGKGINVSKTLKALGMESVICTAVAGPDGEKLAGMLRNDFEVISVSYPSGNTRTNIKIAGEDGVTTDINAVGPLYDKNAVVRLQNHILEKLKAEDIVVISGSAPAKSPNEIYADLIRSFRTVEGVRVILDTSGSFLSSGLEAGPFMIKPNRDELGIGPDLVTAGKEAVKIAEQYGTCCLLSMGKEGAVYADPEGTFFSSRAHEVKALNTTGCGDAMTAGLAYSLEMKMPKDEMFRLCMAVSAAAAETEGTDPPSLERVRELLAVPICGQ